MDYVGLGGALVCAIPVVAIICEAVKECFRIKYNKDDKNFENCS